jgi:hypothetical protein
MPPSLVSSTENHFILRTASQTSESSENTKTSHSYLKKAVADPTGPPAHLTL